MTRGIALGCLCFATWGGGGQGYKEKKGGRRRQQCGVEVVEISARLSIVRENKGEPSTRENWEPFDERDLDL